ncbi:putative cytochrome p450 protein [Phaeoacremonium minimum UCRPA7]|uniref:Putative cytochrome p450 protein n=1 Tax=Phaeoacremonium minimum (strain UCR-PA7) TaxID=1286976 RepID=R8BST8_PHAM7|nr:putative cytochrome p450 protein [Phaeoacremonium minimum UCRPA7]EOO02406.1 putative cytochrome p450 protein [Phaeoacremonium minimum UCRPA7]
MELDLPRTYHWVFLLVIIVSSAVIFRKKERLPDVEFLRISAKPGKAGNADDVYFIAAPKFLEELRKAPETHISQVDAANIIFQLKYTFHPALEQDLYHFDVVRKSLTQNLPRIIPDLEDETKRAFALDLGKPSEWTEAQVYSLASKVVTRVSNRMMVGPDLCRNDEFLFYSGAFTKATFDSAAMLRNMPSLLKPLMMYFMTDHMKQQQIARKCLVPIIKERLSIMENRHDAKDMPNDALQWLLEISPADKRDPEILLQRMLHINVTAIHAPAVTLTECIFDLCRHPDIHEELRTEIAEVFGSKPQGSVWTKANVENLIKLDSFIRESARLTPMSAGKYYHTHYMLYIRSLLIIDFLPVKMERLAIQDYRLSDGTLIPRGTSIGIISHGRQIDDDIFPNAAKFDAFRFAKMRAQPEMASQYTFAQASSENLLFGLGRHACPGRHFASVLLKLLLVHILVNYDIKFVDGKPMPQGKWTQKFRNPDFTASIAWREREIEERFASL